MFYIYVDGQLLNRPLEESLIAFSPRLALEMGKAGSLEFSLPQNNIYYNSIRKLKTIVTVEMDDVEIFRGRVLSYDRNFNNVKKFYVEGNLAYLVDSVQKPEKYTGTTHALFRKIIEAHNAQVEAEKRFVVGNINIEDREIIIRGQSDETEDPETGEFDYRQIAINSTTSDWSTSYDYIESCLIEYCGGYLRTRRVGSTTYIDLLTDYGNNAIQNIEFGTNMLDLSEEATAEEVFTVLIPIGDDNLTIESVNGGSNELVDAEGVALYGRIVKTHVFDNVLEASTLLENAQRFMANHENIPITFTIKAVDLHLVDSDVQEIYVGDSVMVKSAPHGLGSRFICTRIEYDLENPANNTYTFGNPRQTLTQRYREDKRKEEDSEHTGGSGGAGGAGGAADDKAKENLDKFYNAWINVLPEQGHIDLGAVYNELKNGKEVLKQQVGIDLDAPTGHVNIYAMRQDLTALDGRVVENSAEIELWANELKSQIDAHVGWSEKFEGQTKAWHAQLLLEANKNGEAIAALKTTHEKRLADLELKSTKLEASALMKAQYDENRRADLALISNLESTVASLSAAHAGRLSALELKSTELEASALMKAVYDENRRADLKLISNLDSTVASLSSSHDGRLSSLEAKTTSLEASMLLKATYDKNRTADLKLISNAERSIATLSASHGNRLSSLETRATNLETSVVMKATYDAKIASIEAKATSQGSQITANANAIKTKASTYSLNAAVTTINDRIKIVEDDISGIDELIANKIAAADIDTSKLVSKTIRVTGLTADNLYANNYVSAPRLSMGGALVATQNWVNDLIDGLATTTWVNEQGFATQSWVSGKNYWGSVSNGKAWLYANGSSKYVALGNHTHDYAASSHTHDYASSSHTHDWNDITGKPSYFSPKSHRHSFSFSKSAANGHTHKVTVNGTTYTSQGVSTNVTHKIEVSGNTGYTGG